MKDRASLVACVAASMASAFYGPWCGWESVGSVKEGIGRVRCESAKFPIWVLIEWTVYFTGERGIYFTRERCGIFLRTVTSCFKGLWIRQ